MTNNPMEQEDIVEALRELVRELQKTKTQVKIRIVGGAALALLYFTRPATTDIDSLDFKTADIEAVRSAISKVSHRRNLPPDWLNTEVSGIDAFPTVGKEVEWVTIFSEDGIEILVASAEALLAMKLKANRAGRDTDDIRKLMKQINILNLSQVEDLFSEYYPGEILSERASGTATNILAESNVPFPKPPKRPSI